MLEYICRKFSHPEEAVHGGDSNSTSDTVAAHSEDGVEEQQKEGAVFLIKLGT